MEKKTSNLRKKLAKLLSLLHAATSSITTTFLVSPPPSPRKPSSSKPLSTSIIPSEARRRRPKNGTTSFDTREPTSPKVSCLGQVTHKEKPNTKPKPKPKPKPNTKTLCCSAQDVKVVKKKHKKCVKENVDNGPKDNVDYSNNGKKIAVPSLREMKRLTTFRVVSQDPNSKVIIPTVVSDHGGLGKSVNNI